MQPETVLSAAEAQRLRQSASQLECDLDSFFYKATHRTIDGRIPDWIVTARAMALILANLLDTRPDNAEYNRAASAHRVEWCSHCGERSYLGKWYDSARESYRGEAE